MEDNLKIWKMNISATTGWTLLKFENWAIGIKQERTKVLFDCLIWWQASSELDNGMEMV